MPDGNLVHRPGVEPVAIVGIGCRFAGDANSPDEFWDLLIGGVDATGNVPEGRWDPYLSLGPEHAAVLRGVTRRGGYIKGIDEFDAEFFGVTPREAEVMDPQQRILLEVAWEALEHAGIPPHTLAGTEAGVFVGVGSDDYGRRLLEDLPRIEAWSGIGAAMCAVANRISYALDFRGPSLAVDTACSASLVALHLACQSLRLGESSLALTGGINLLVSPGLTLSLDAAGATAPDGRSKSFDATADGYGRGEGCGILVLKLLADAERDGDRVLSVIRGSAVSQDGRTNGIMAPSGPAQEHVLGLACRQAGVEPGSIGYVEAHGTGTRMGDPIEAGALSAVYGAGRDEPCLIGSVKSNIGHLEAAAGVAGVIKAVLTLVREDIPPTIHHTRGNPAVDWDSSGLRVVTERTPWPRGASPRRAGVSGFGYGGTIAHLVLEEASAPAPTAEGSGDDLATDAAGPRLYPLSAATEQGLREQAGRLADALTGPGAALPLGSLGRTLALHRTHLDQRVSVVADGREELATALREVADGRTPVDTPATPGEGLVWVFSGHGSQWAGMGRELLDGEPVFARVLAELDPIYLKEIGFSPIQVLRDGDLDEVSRIQTLTFATQVALAELWRSRGVRPDAVIGHSVGEIAASVAAGALTPEQGARLVCRRSKLLRRAAGKGAMAMVSLPFDEVEARLADHPGVVAGIYSAPNSTVVAGDITSIEELIPRWRSEGIPMRRVATDVAFHSPHMDPLLDDLAEACADLSPREPVIPMYSTTLTDPRGGAPTDAAYWVANLRAPVRLAAAVEAAAQDGYRSFLEISAHPVVTHSIDETLGTLGVSDGFVGGTLRRARPERAAFLAALGALHSSGRSVDWNVLQPSGTLIDLPAYPWQRRRHWREATAHGSGEGLQLDVEAHSLLGSAISVAGRSQRLWRARLTDGGRPYPGSHTINGVEIVPAAVLVSTFLQAGERAGTPPVLTDVTLRAPLATAESRELQVLLEDGAVRLSSRRWESGDDAWLLHSTATLVHDDSADLPVLGDRPLSPTATDLIERRLAEAGVPTMAFPWTVEELRSDDGVLVALVRAEATTWAPLLDAAFSAAPVAFPGPAVLRMVAGLTELRLAGPPPELATIEVTVADDTATVLIADVDGRTVALITGLRFGVLDGDTGAAPARPGQLVHELVWRPLELPEPGAHRDLVVVGSDTDLIDALRAAGVEPRIHAEPGELDLDAACDVLVLPPAPDADDSATGQAAAALWRLAHTAQLITGPEAAPGIRLWSLTRGVREAREETGLRHSPLWGLGRVIAGEHPEIWGGIIDLPALPGDVPGDLVAQVVDAAPGEDVIALADGTAVVARLAVPAEAPEADPADRVTCHADGTYAITGGLGVLGIEIANWLADRGARRLVLIGRRGLPPRRDWDGPEHVGLRAQIDAVLALEARGVTVRTLSLDISDADQAALLLDLDALGLPPIRGVVHAAGVLDSRLLPSVDEESFRNVLRPKVEGARVLHWLFPPGTLDFLVLFSSCGHLLGISGQASYGAANAYLDALAVHRGATGSNDTFSLGWTSWQGKGMAVNEIVDMEIQDRGVAAVTADEAFGAWDLAHRHGAGYYAVLRPTAWDPARMRLPVLRELVSPEAATPGQSDGGGASFAGLSPDELRSVLITEVGMTIAAEMRLPESALDARRSLAEQGLDSVMTMMIRRRLERRFGQSLPATLLWHQPTIIAIAEHLADLLSGVEDPTAPDREAAPVAGA